MKYDETNQPAPGETSTSTTTTTTTETSGDNAGDGGDAAKTETAKPDGE